LIHDGRARRWRHHDLAGMKLHLRYRIQRAHCPDCGTVKTERVPWAAHGSNFTYAFEERAAFLAQQCSKTAVVTLLRTERRRSTPLYVEGGRAHRAMLPG
jgi:transposase